MLLNNYQVASIGDCGMRFPGALHVDRTAHFSQRAFMQLHGSLSNYSQGIQPGYPPAYTWVPPQKGGAMSAGLTGSGSITNANLAGGINLSADLTGTGGITSASIVALGNMVAALTGTGGVTSAGISGALPASASLTGTGGITDAGITGALFASADLTGTGGITNAGISGGLYASANLTGEGGITNAGISGGIFASAALTGTGGITDANLTGAFRCSANLTGSGGITNAGINALGNMVAALTGTGTVVANINAVGNMSADITGQGEVLDASNVGQLVWQYIVAPDTTAQEAMVELLNSGAGGGPSVSAIANAVWAHATAILQQKISLNRQLLDETAGTLTIFDDDGVTPLLVAAVKDKDGVAYDGTKAAHDRGKLE